MLFALSLTRNWDLTRAWLLADLIFVFKCKEMIRSNANLVVLKYFSSIPEQVKGLLIAWTV